jgi:uncharacterized protein (TIGR00251 family)
MAGGRRGDHDQLTPFTSDGDGIRLSVRVTPRARKSAVTGLVEVSDGRVALAVKLAAPPVDGAANDALIAFLAAGLGVGRSSVQIVSGEKSRLKMVRIAGLSAAAVHAWLANSGVTELTPPNP